jgi:hypothetical protein
VSRAITIRSRARIPVAIVEKESVEPTRLGADLELSVAWMIRRAVSEFIARHGGELGSGLPLRPASSGRGRPEEHQRRT